MAKHDDEVSDVMRLMLDFMKTARRRLEQSKGTNDDAGTEPSHETDEADVKMTPDGFPLLPKIVLQREMNKAVSERILRAYLSQHYCVTSNS